MTTRVINIKLEEVPDGYVYCGRPGPFGNPFQSGTRDTNVENFKRMFLERVKVDERFRKAVLAVKGKTLGCFCVPKRCHAQVIADWVDAQP